MAIMQGTFGRLLEPGLRKVFMDTYKEVPEQFSKIYNVQDSKKAIETDARMGGMGLWEGKEEAGSVKYQDPSGMQTLQYIHEEFASGFTVTRKMVDDEQYGTMNKRSRQLARTARATIETKAAIPFNNAFTTAGYDGQPLVSANHVRLDGGKASNLITGNPSLSDAALKDGILLARKQTDESGILIQVQPKLLVVPPELEHQALTILRGTNVSLKGDGTTNTTDRNVLPNLKVVVWDYLTDPNAWFLIDPTVAELNFFWRKRLEFANESDFDTMQAKYRGYMRFSVGYSDFRGVIGSKGTNAA